MALAWLLAKEEITSVLVGASRPSQILDNIKAVENTGFTAEELAEIDRLSGQLAKATKKRSFGQCRLISAKKKQKPTR